MSSAPDTETATNRSRHRDVTQPDRVITHESSQIAGESNPTAGLSFDNPAWLRQSRIPRVANRAAICARFASSS